MPRERLQKILAAAGVASRRASEALISAGRVTVDGRVAHLGEQADPAAERIAVDGVALRPPSTLVHLVLHKPAGMVSTASDRHAERIVLDLLPEPWRSGAGRLYPVGRLDRDSEGLLLITNDGAWADRVLHPRYEVEREYAVGLGASLDPEQRRALAAGIELEEGIAQVEHLRPATTTETRRLTELMVPKPPKLAWYRATLRQGWKRQLRRMFAAVEAPIARLVRVRIGSLRLDDLPSGEVRELTPSEVRQLTVDAAILPTMHPAPDERRRLVVALDGPGSSGKSSVGAAAALRLGYRFCDTGLLYRALTWLALHRSVPLDDGPQLANETRRVELAPDAQGRLDRVVVDGVDVTSDVHTPAVDDRVSEVSRQPEVRAALLERQRDLARTGGIIMAGRDIGTVILPDADLKLYLEASVEERARRRALERHVAPDGEAARQILADMRRRDEIDSTRPVAPLRIAEDAHVLRTDANRFEETVDAVVQEIRAAEDRLAVATREGAGSRGSGA